MIKTKICGRCKILKNSLEFNKNKARYDGLHSVCKECRKIVNPKYSKKYWENNYHYKQKFIVIAYYSMSEMCCRNCRYNNIKALEIDHINNDGAKHRKEIKGGHLYSWLINNNFPDGFQVLCATCNALKRIESNKNKKIIKGYRYNKKFIIIAHYTYGEMCCVKCNFNNIKGLQVDHINGNGNKHIKNLLKNGKDFYTWIIENDFPDDLQILCRNCNVLKRFENNEFRNQYSK